MTRAFAARFVHEGPHQRHATALLQADGIFGDVEIGIRDKDAAKAAVVAEFAGEHRADAEARRHRLAHALAGLHLDDGARLYVGSGHGLFKHFARDRAALAQHQLLAGQRRERRAAALGEGMARRREQHQPVGAQADGMEARVRDALGHHRDIGLVAQQALQHDGGIVDREREGEALGAFPERGHDRHDVMRRIGGDPQMPAGQGLLARQQRAGLVLQRKQPRGERHAAAGRSRSA